MTFTTELMQFVGKEFRSKFQLKFHKRIAHKDETKYKWVYKYWQIAFDSKTELIRHIENKHYELSDKTIFDLKRKDLSLNDQVTQIWNEVNKKKILFIEYFDSDSIFFNINSKKTTCKYSTDIKEESSVHNFDESKSINQISEELNSFSWKDAKNKIDDTKIKVENSSEMFYCSDLNYQWNSNLFWKEDQYSSSKSINSTWLSHEEISKNYQKSNFSDLSVKEYSDSKSENIDNWKSAFSKVVRKDTTAFNNTWTACTEPITFDSSELDCHSFNVASTFHQDLGDNAQDSDNEESENIICINLNDLEEAERREEEFKSELNLNPFSQPKKILYAPIPIRAPLKCNQGIQTDDLQRWETSDQQTQFDKNSLIPEDTMIAIKGMFIEFMKVYLQIQDPRIEDIIKPCFN